MKNLDAESAHQNRSKKLPRIMVDETKLYSQQTLLCRVTRSTRNQKTGTSFDPQLERYNAFLEDKQHPVLRAMPQPPKEPSTFSIITQAVDI